MEEFGHYPLFSGPEDSTHGSTAVAGHCPRKSETKKNISIVKSRDVNVIKFKQIHNLTLC